jgi:hypothetical protein
MESVHHFFLNSVLIFFEKIKTIVDLESFLPS